jgi:hypothetical protein
MGAEATISENIDRIIVIGSVTAPKSLGDALIRSINEKAGITEIIREEPLLTVNGPRNRCQDNQAAILAGEVHSVISASGEQMTGIRAFERLQLLALAADAPSRSVSNPVVLEPGQN